jgi:hypothetical protein
LSNDKLESVLELLLDSDLAPVFLPQIERQFNPRLYDLFQELLDETLAKMPDNVEDLKVFVATLPEAAQHLLRIRQLVGPISRTDVASSICVAQLDSMYFNPKRWFKNEGKVLDRFHELRKQLDEDGLLRPTRAMKLLRTGISYQGYLIYYHQFMRRGFAWSMNWKFFERLHSAMEGNEVAVGIDTFRLIRLDQFRERMEEDYWYGPKFNLAKIDDPNDYGFTMHLGKTTTISDRSIRSEFYRYVRNNEKIFEIEEVALPQSGGSQQRDFIINRYVHSIRDMRNHHFVHLDGAVRIYSKGSYDRRVATDLPSSAKSDLYIKLFKLNGKILDSDWAELISHFFRENDDVRQFLGGKT